jgi:carboxylate-amine ligase
LARGLVATILRDVHAGAPAPRIPHHLLTAAHWRAAHDGLEGLAVDLQTRQTRPAWQLLRQLFDRVSPELARHGDLEMATVLLGRLRAKGTGAARQRAVHAKHGTMAAVVDHLAAQTRG